MINFYYLFDSKLKILYRWHMIVDSISTSPLTCLLTWGPTLKADAATPVAEYPAKKKHNIIKPWVIYNRVFTGEAFSTLLVASSLTSIRSKCSTPQI